MGFSRQEYWSGLPCLPSGNLPNSGIEPACLTIPALASSFFLPLVPPGKPLWSEWPLLKSLQVGNAGEGIEKGELPYTMVGM